MLDRVDLLAQRLNDIPMRRDKKIDEMNGDGVMLGIRIYGEFLDMLDRALSVRGMLDVPTILADPADQAVGMKLAAG